MFTVLQTFIEKPIAAGRPGAIEILLNTDDVVPVEANIVFRLIFDRFQQNPIRFRNFYRLKKIKLTERIPFRPLE